MYRFLLCSRKNAFQSQVIGHIKSCVRPKNDQTEDTHNWVWEHIFYVRNGFGHVQQQQKSERIKCFQIWKPKRRWRRGMRKRKKTKLIKIYS